MAKRIAGFIPGFLVFLSGLSRIPGGDILWHLRFGEYWIKTGAPLSADIFSHTMRGRPLPPHAPLFQWVVAALFDLAGWPALVLCRASLLTALFALTVRFTRNLGARGLLYPWLMAALFTLGSPQFFLHPQLFLFLFVAFLLCLGHRRFLLSSAIVLVWPLFHPSFPVGIGLLLLFGATEASRRRALRWFASAFTVALVIFLLEPRFFHNVWRHAESPAMLESVRYWRPLWEVIRFEPSQIWISLNALLLMGLFAFVAFERQFWRKEGAFFLGFAGFAALLLAIRSVRFLPLLPLVLAPPVLAHFESRVKPIPAAVYTGLAAIFFVSASWFSPGFSLDTRKLPVRCAEFLSTHPLPGSLYNSYGFGGYLIYALGESHPVFIDPRASQLYPDAFLDRFLKAYDDPKVFEELVKEYGVGHTFLRTTSARTAPLLRYLNESPAWELAYSDPICTIHRKRQTAP